MRSKLYSLAQIDRWPGTSVGIVEESNVSLYTFQKKNQRRGVTELE